MCIVTRWTFVTRQMSETVTRDAWPGDSLCNQCTTCHEYLYSLLTLLTILPIVVKGFSWKSPLSLSLSLSFSLFPSVLFYPYPYSSHKFRLSMSHESSLSLWVSKLQSSKVLVIIPPFEIMQSPERIGELILSQIGCMCDISGSTSRDRER